MKNSPRVWAIFGGRPRGQSDGVHRQLEIEMDEAFKKGMIALGWPMLGDLSELGCDKGAYKQRFNDVFPDQGARSVAADVTTLHWFACIAEEGDLVVYRSRSDGDFYFGRISGPYTYQSDAHWDYVHRRSVKWLKRVSPSAIAVEARRSIAIGRSFIPADKEADEFRRQLDG